MAIAVDARATGANSAGATTLTWNHTVGASLTNSVLLVGSGHAGASAITITGVNWDQLGTPTAMTNKGVKSDGGTGNAEVWFLLAPSAGTKQVKVTYSASASCATGSASYSGVDQTTVFNAASPQGASGTTSTASLTVTSAVGEEAVAAMLDNENSGGDTLVGGGGQTSIFNTTVGGNIAAAAADASGASTVTISWTGLTLSAPWAVSGLSLLPAGAAAPSGGQWVGSGSRRAPAKAGPFDQRGFLLSPYQQYSYVPVAAVAATTLQRKTLSPLGTHTGGRQSQ